MNIFSDQGSYFLLVLVGMAAVALHAFQLYGQQIITPEKSGGNRLLDSISAMSLGGRYQFYRGYALYLAISELIYVLLASSSVILELTLTAVGRQDMAGALSSGVALNPTVPIVASTALIAATQTRPFSEYEKVLRRLAHGIAGIPGNVFNLHSKLNRALGERTTLALGTARQGLDQPVPSDSESSSAASGTRASSAGTADSDDLDILDHAVGEAIEIMTTVDRVSGLSAMDRRQFERSLVKVHCLFRWTLGYDGERIWTGRQTVGLLDLFSSAEQAVDSLFDKIDVLVKQEQGANPAPPDGRSVAEAEGDSLSNSSAAIGQSLAPATQWRQIFTQCSRLENELLTLLALLLLNKPEVDLEPYRTLQPLRAQVMSPQRDTVLSAYAVSLIAAALLATTLVSGYLGGKAVFKHQIRSAVNVDALAPAFADNELPLVRGNLPWAVLHDSVLGRGVPAEKQAQFHDGVLNAAALIGETLTDAAVAVSQYLTIFALSAGIALGLRRLRKLESRWPFRQAARAPPVITYLSIGSSAYVFATSALLLLTFANLAISPALQFGVSVFDEATLIQIEKVLPRVFLLPLLSIVCVWFVCTLIDSLDPDSPANAAPIQAERGNPVLDAETAEVRRRLEHVRIRERPASDSKASSLIPLLPFTGLFYRRWRHRRTSDANRGADHGRSDDVPRNTRHDRSNEASRNAEHGSFEAVNRGSRQPIVGPIAWLSLLVLTVTLVLPWALSSIWSYRFHGAIRLMPPAVLALVLAGIAIITVGYLLRQQTAKSVLKISLLFGCLCGLFDLILNLVFNLVGSAWDIPDTFFIAALCFFAFLVSFQLVFQRFPPQTSDRSNWRADHWADDSNSEPVSHPDPGMGGMEGASVGKVRPARQRPRETTLTLEHPGE